MRHTLVVLVLTMLAVGLARTAGAEPRSAPNPCSLVTAADVKAVLATPVGRGKLQPLGLYQSCTYTNGRVTVTVRREPSRKPIS
jgi:hypothetical protein